MTFHGNMAQEKTQNLLKCLYIYKLEYSEKPGKLSFLNGRICRGVSFSLLIFAQYTVCSFA